MLSRRFSGNLQSTPEEHNLAAFSNASAILTSTCGIISGTVYKYICIYFLLEVSDSDCILSSILHGYTACQALKGQRTFFVLIYVLLLGLWAVSGTNTNYLILHFQEGSTEMLNGKKSAHILPARSPEVQGIAGGGICQSIATWLDWGMQTSCRPQLEQCSCGTLAKGVVILAKYWPCLSAFLLTVQTD